MEESFARVETKYLLTVAQAEHMAGLLRRNGFSHMRFGSPTVQSLYYDTPDYRLIQDSLARPAYKEKLRLRAYGRAGEITNTFLEVKKKYRGVVYKRRTPFPLRESMLGLAAGALPEEAGQVGREALWMVRRYGLQPAAVISYDRDAWLNPAEPDVRITFDRNLTFRSSVLDLEAAEPGISLLSPGLRLMEVKSCGVYPLWLARSLSEVDAKRTHFSKYGQAYLQYLRFPAWKEGVKISV